MSHLIESATQANNGMQRSADTTASIFGKGAARPLMPGVGRLPSDDRVRMITQSPAEAAALLDEAIDRGDLDAVMDFYEDGAVLVADQVMLAEGKDEIGEVYRWIFSNIEGATRQGETYIVEAGDIALLTSGWDASGMNPDGDFVSRESFASVIMRRARDGRWRIVVDNSWSYAVLC